MNILIEIQKINRPSFSNRLKYTFQPNRDLSYLARVGSSLLSIQTRHSSRSRYNSTELDHSTYNRATINAVSTLYEAATSSLKWSQFSHIAEARGLSRDVASTPCHRLPVTRQCGQICSYSSNPKRPQSREELLAAAHGIWSRLRIRFKWFSIRSARPFNADDISAFFSWVLLGHMLWIILGTTTFFSLALLTANTVFAQEKLARWVGSYLTHSLGLTIIFESAIVPRWRDGVISFKKVLVSRRSGDQEGRVYQGAWNQSAATFPASHSHGVNPTAMANQGAAASERNQAEFDLSIDTVNVTLSFRKWFNGRGLLRDVEMSGVRGELDRSHVRSNHPRGVDQVARQHRSPGDFELDSFRLEDLLITVHQPNGFRPFPISIYNCELPRLRRQWLFYDFLAANTMSGSFDNSLFTLHPQQAFNYVGKFLPDSSSIEDRQSSCGRRSRIRIDGLKIEHLNANTAAPFSWINRGSLDIVADMVFPKLEESTFSAAVTGVFKHLQSRVFALISERHRDGAVIPSRHSERDCNDTNQVPERNADADFNIIMDLKLGLINARASVPLFTKDLSYANNALIRPIVAYINARRTLIPIKCRVTKSLDEFDGSWTIFDSGLLDDLSHETYQAISRDVADDQARIRRLKKVGYWSFQLAVQALFLGLAGNFT